jgi:GMP synthase (glutamine-hydrolysing)
MSEAGARQTMLVLQHADCEPPGVYEDELLERGIALQRVAVDRCRTLPDWRAYAGIVVMGGAMGAYDDALYPWLGPEKRLIAEAVSAGRPYWGVCLGAQLLAASLGACVSPGPRPELGVLPVELTSASAGDPVFAAAPQTFSTLQWHGDTYELPEGAVQLARSQLYEQQAFVVGRAYGLQFHLEVSHALGVEWMRIPAYVEELERLGGSGCSSALVEQLKAAEPESVPLARALFSRWLVHVVGVPAAAGLAAADDTQPPGSLTAGAARPR